MKLREILDNEDLRRHEFPVAKERIFLAHAGDCPLPRRVAEAVKNYADLATRADQELPIYPAVVNQARALASRLLNAKPEEVALVGPTSLGLSLIASGLKFRKHDNVLIYFDDYPPTFIRGWPWRNGAFKSGSSTRAISASSARWM